MDHAEEQAMELEALEAIYTDDFSLLPPSPHPSFELRLLPETGGGDDVNHVGVTLTVRYTPTYPETPPSLSVRPFKGLEGGVAALQAIVEEAAASEELAGTPMVYAIVEMVKEWLQDHNQPDRDLHAEMMARLDGTGLSFPLLLPSLSTPV